VDACHARGLGVCLDVVYNHLGPSGNYLPRFAPFFTDRHKTPWGEAINLDGADSDGVRAFVLDNARMWLVEHHVDGLRVDAIHAIVDPTALPLLEELTALVADLSVELGKALVVVAESDLNDPRVVAPREQHGLGFTAQWSDDFHHALHRALTGETGGYYGDTGGLADVARALSRGWVADGGYVPSRRRRHGRPFTGAGHQLVGFAQNHDQVGNRAKGERLAALAGPARAKIALALVLTAPFVPLLFAGEEWGAVTPFLYFIDHEPDLAKAVFAGRKAEFAAFHTDGDVPDPQARSTFTQSRLRFADLDDAGHRDVLAFCRALIALRRAHPALRDGDLAAVRCR
jgi:maltooligosyltrehalose trehalohydrolase